MTATGERGRVLVLCDFTGKRLTHAGLAHLRNLPRLSSVALYGPGFGEYSLPHLSTLPALQLLTLAECEYRVDALRRFARSMPNLTSIHPLT